MVQITDFAQIRSDGNRVPSGMTVDEMLSLGWGPSRIFAFTWKANGRDMRREGPYGLHGIVVPGANFIAAIVDQDESGMTRQLEILAPDRSIVGSLENRLVTSGREYTGCFQWFEPAMHSHIDRFGAVFQSNEGGSFRCDIDAAGPGISAVIPIR